MGVRKGNKGMEGGRLDNLSMGPQLQAKTVGTGREHHGTRDKKRKRKKKKIPNEKKAPRMRRSRGNNETREGEAGGNNRSKNVMGLFRP